MDEGKAWKGCEREDEGEKRSGELSVSGACVECVGGETSGERKRDESCSRMAREGVAGAKDDEDEEKAENDDSADNVEDVDEDEEERIGVHATLTAWLRSAR